MRGIFLALATTLGIMHPASSTADSVSTTSISVQAPTEITGSWNPTSLSTPPVAVNNKVVTAKELLAKEAPPVSANMAKWDTADTDPTAYRVALDDPTRKLPASVQETFACIRYVESRNHPNSVNVTSGAQGLYQFLPYLWTYGAKALGITTTSAIYATPQQQSAVAVWYWTRNNGFAPEWFDGCAGE